MRQKVKRGITIFAIAAALTLSPLPSAAVAAGIELAAGEIGEIEVAAAGEMGEIATTWAEGMAAGIELAAGEIGEIEVAAAEEIGEIATTWAEGEEEGAVGEEGASLSLLERVLNYKNTVAGRGDTIHTNLYLSYSFDVARRNFILPTIPSMRAISRDERTFAGESFSDVTITDGVMIDAVRRVSVGTIPRYRNVMPTMMKYLTPNIYEKTLFNNQMLSPFNEHNTRLYTYRITHDYGNLAEIKFRRKRRNTQLIGGSALVDKQSGRILWMHIRGEYDMIVFYISATMGLDGAASLYPKTCDIDATFRFLGNKVSATYHSVFNNMHSVPDTLVNAHDVSLIESVRPGALAENVQTVYASHDSLLAVRDSLGYGEDKHWDRVLWDAVGTHVVRRTKGTFGSDNQGSFRLSPLLSPLYLGYSKRKGITYKLRFRAKYDFTPNRSLSLNLRAAYSFKIKHLYYSLPLTFHYNKRKNAYVVAEVGNANRITYRNVDNDRLSDQLDSLGYSDKDMKTFKDFYFKVVNNYDFSQYWGGQVGIVYHRRSAVNKEGFRVLGLDTHYFSLAPWLQLTWRPWGWRGPSFSASYERGIKVGKADLQYERIEVDASWRRPFNRLRSMSLRLGGGLYTMQGKGAHFLDFTNFRDENIPSGWNDWSGTFQLLHSYEYNSSKYYVRANATYESPLMLLSFIPVVGRLMETERIYVNALLMEKMHPYMEYGYGFTTRFFSAGAYIAFRNFAYDGIGCRVAFELFRDW